MKPVLKIIGVQQDKTYQIMKVCEPYFFPSWHFHPEFEIMLVLEGTGIRFVGDSMERFQPGDLIFYGNDIPHLYRSDKQYYQKENEQVSKAIVIYFKENFLGESFWNLPDTALIKKLFSNSRRGIKFKGQVKEELKRKIWKLDDNKDGISRIIDLLSILRTMANCEEYNLLSSNAFIAYANNEDCERINKVYQFIMDNYSDNPSLEQVAKTANMSATAFCRYFKSRTNKTYIQILNEIKIGNACKLLIDNDLSISQVCFETGFNNFTHFNSQFKRIIGITPTQYKDRHFIS